MCANAHKARVRDIGSASTVGVIDAGNPWHFAPPYVSSCDLRVTGKSPACNLFASHEDEIKVHLDGTKKQIWRFLSQNLFSKPQLISR